MNARTDTHAARSFDAVSYSEWSYTMTEAEMRERFDDVSIEDRPGGTLAKAWRHEDGAWRPFYSVMLDTPLCRGCDGVIENHFCPRCDLPFIDGVSA